MNVGVLEGTKLMVGSPDGSGVGLRVGTGVVGSDVVGADVGVLSAFLVGMVLVAPYTENKPTPKFTPVVEGYQRAPVACPS